MGIRGYIILKLKETLKPDGLWELTKKYEEIEDVEFAARVVGPYDFVLTIDTKRSFEKALDTVKGIQPAKEAVGLKIDNEYGKHREIRDLKILNELFEA